MKTKIFCDSADFKTIKKLNNNPLVGGFTPNPSLMRLAGAKNYKNYSLKILSVCKKKTYFLRSFWRQLWSNVKTGKYYKFLE